MQIDNPQKFLEQHFPNFLCSLTFHEISFLFQVTESDCGGDNVLEIPCGFILRNCDDPASVLFMYDLDSLVFYGIHLNTLDAHDYACDLLLMELHQSNFMELFSRSTLSTESVDN